MASDQQPDAAALRLSDAAQQRRAAERRLHDATERVQSLRAGAPPTPIGAALPASVQEPLGRALEPARPRTSQLAVPASRALPSADEPQHA
eukprot:2495095-Prymnesium_polylepis.1